MKRNRILHLRASNFVGGPERQILRHANSQRNGPWEILIGAFRDPQLECELLDTIESLGLEGLSLPSNKLRQPVSALIDIIRKRQIGLLCTHGYKADIIGVLAGRLAQVPVACFLRGWTGETWKVRVYERIDAWCLRYADRIVCLSQSQAHRISHRPSIAGKIRVVINAIDAQICDAKTRAEARSRLRSRLQLPADCRVVATAGRLSPEKGVADFLTAISLISDRSPDVKFVVFGHGAMRKQLELQADGLRIRDAVMFAGFHKDLQELLPGIDVLVNPSLSEEMPNILLEAMAASIPVVATSVGAVAEIAGPDRALHLVPPSQPPALADAMRELLAQPEHAAALGHAGFDRVHSAYSLAAQRRQFDALYGEFLSPCAESAPPPARLDSIVMPT